MSKNLKGFTLVELMIVIAIIAVLSTVTLFGVANAQKAARDTKRAQIMNGFRVALERYNGDKNSYPTSFGPIVPGYMAAPTDPGCGGAVTAIGTGISWVPCTGVTYAIAGDGATYALTLTKEAGGVLSYLSPK